MKTNKEIYNFIQTNTKPEWFKGRTTFHLDDNYTQKRVDNFIKILSQFGFAVICAHESITGELIKFDCDLNILEAEFKKVDKKVMDDLLDIKENVIISYKFHEIADYIKQAEQIVTAIDTSIKLDKSLSYSQKDDLIVSTIYPDDTLLNDEYWNLRTNPHFDNEVGKMYRLLATIYSYAARNSGELEIYGSNGVKLFYSKKSNNVSDVLNKKTGKGYVYEETPEEAKKSSVGTIDIFSFQEVINHLSEDHKMITWTKDQVHEYKQRDYNPIEIDSFYFDSQYNPIRNLYEIVISLADKHYYIGYTPECNQ